MTGIPIGRVGRITAGENAGWFVLVQYTSLDGKSTDDFLVLEFSSPNPSMAREGYDGWVEKREHLAEYFAAKGWTVDWSEVPENP